MSVFSILKNAPTSNTHCIFLTALLHAKMNPNICSVMLIAYIVVLGNAYIMVPPKNTTANEGTRVKLNCQAEGYPNNITYRWFKNGEDVQTVSQGCIPYNLVYFTHKMGPICIDTCIVLYIINDTSRILFFGLKGLSRYVGIYIRCTLLTNQVKLVLWSLDIEPQDKKYIMLSKGISNN